jgi:hypothetical protein
MPKDSNNSDFFRQAINAINLVEQPITYQDYINNKETTTEAEKVDKNKLKAWYDKYSKYESNNYSNLVWGMIKAWTDTGILTDAYEENEWAAVVDKFGEDKADEMEIDEVMKYMPITKAMHDEIEEMFGQGGEDTLEMVYQMLTSMGVNFVGEDSEYDADMTPEKDHDDHEVNMAKSQMFQAMQYAKDIYSMLEKVSEQEGIEGWVAAKLTKASDYLSSVKHYIEHEMSQANMAGESEMDEKAPPGREKQVKKLKKKFDDPGAPYAIAWAQHNKHGKPNKESQGESTMTDDNKKLNEGIRIQTDSLEDSIALMTILKNAGIDPQQMNIQTPSQDMSAPEMPAPDMTPDAPDMTPDVPAEIPGEEPKDVPMDEPEAEGFDNAPDEKFLDKDDYELKRNKVPNSKMGPSSARLGDNPLPEAKAKPDFLDVDKDGDKKEPMKKAVKDKEKMKEEIDAIAEQLNKDYEMFKKDATA